MICFVENNDERRIFQFSAKKAGGLNTFDTGFLKIFNNNPKD
jgi:hypothetical protein